MSEKDVQKDRRARSWSWIVYPESAPDNWRQLLDETGENGLRALCTIKILTKQQMN